MSEPDTRASLILQLTEAQLAKEVWAKISDDPAVISTIRERFLAGLRLDVGVNAYRPEHERTPHEVMVFAAYEAAVKDSELNALVQAAIRARIEAELPRLVDELVRSLFQRVSRL